MLRTVNKWQARQLLIARWPTAVGIRDEGKCHCKHKRAMLSFQLPEYDGPRGADEETCGYYCASCNWGNAGSRPIVPPDIEHEEVEE